MVFKNSFHQQHWKKLFETEHANAVISDGFWYIICKVFKKPKEEDPKSGLIVAISSQVNPYEGYQEFLLDRIAANYVSFTVLEEEDEVSDNPFAIPENRKKKKHVDVEMVKTVQRRFFE